MVLLLALKITFLGTSASIPTKKRGQVSIADQRGRDLLLFDAEVLCAIYFLYIDEVFIYIL